MNYQTKCFISYAHVDKDFVREIIIPVLKELDLDIWFDEEQIVIGDSITDSIIKGIRQADLIVAVFNNRSKWMNFEVGAAIGQTKPIIAVLREYYGTPSDLSHIHYINYSKGKEEELGKKLKSAISIVKENIIDRSIFEIVENEKVIGIRIGFDKVDFEKELRLTAEFVKIIKEVSGTKKVSLIQTNKGSFTSFFSIGLKAWAELLEKLAFFIPEWKKREAENLKIHSEIRKLNAETERIISETQINELRQKMEQAETMLNLLLKCKGLGIKLQIDDDAIISFNQEGLLKIKQPELLKLNS